MATQQFGSSFEILPYPNNYIELWVGQTVGIIHIERAQRPRTLGAGTVIYGQVSNKEDLPWMEIPLVGLAARFPARVGAGVDVLAAGVGLTDFGSLDDFLEPGPEILYIVAGPGIYSDRDVTVQVRHGGTTGNLYGTKNFSDQRLDPNTSPYRRPRVTLRAYGDQYSPTFQVANPTDVIAGVVKFSFFGHKYEIEQYPKDEEPARVDKWIPIRQISESGGT